MINILKRFVASVIYYRTRKNEMFSKEKRYLVVTNTVIFLILFSILGTVLYAYTKSVVYRDVDRSFASALKAIQIGSSNNYKGAIPRMDPNNGILIWSEDGQLLESPTHNYYKEIANKVKYKKLDDLYDINYEEYHFRTMAFKVDTEEGKVIIQILRNTNAQMEFLNTLRRILIVGGLMIFGVSIFAAFYLASKALKPIVKAWEKQQLFVSDASHELRTPLTIIQSRLELLLKAPEKPVREVGENIAISLSETRRLSKLVKNLLTLAKADSNVIELDKKIFCLNKAINNICEPYIEIAEFGDKTFIEELEEDVNINADEDRITQLIIILLDNSLKYTNEGDTIKVSLKKKNNKVFITVEDDGIGINAQDLPHIFDRFYRGDKARGREGGHGLGLSIAKWIVDKHSGHIGISSEEGKGTKIEITLPIIEVKKITTANKLQ